MAMVFKVGGRDWDVSEHFVAVCGFCGWLAVKVAVAIVERENEVVLQLQSAAYAAV